MSVIASNQENDPLFQNSPIKAKTGATAKGPSFVLTPSKAKLSTPTRENKQKAQNRSPLQPLTTKSKEKSPSTNTSPSHRLLTPNRSTPSNPKTQVTPSTPTSPSRKFLAAKRTTPNSKPQTLTPSKHNAPEDFENDPRLSPQASLALTTRFRQLSTRTPPPSTAKPQAVGEEVTDHPLTLPPVEYDKFGFEIETPIKAHPCSEAAINSTLKPTAPSTPLTYSRTIARPSIPTPLRTNTTTLWETILADWAHWQDDRLKSLIVLKGIAPAFRPQVWKKLVKYEKGKEGFDQGYYQSLVDMPESKHTTQIKLDIPRTFYTHKLFKTAEGRQRLFNVLKAYSYHNPAVGYCQGMSYVCGVLLMSMPEEEAFWTFTMLMRRLENYYTPTMEGMITDNKIFNKLLQLYLPTLHKHLENSNIETLLFTSRWFLSIFTDFPNWETVLHTWDVFMLMGRKGLLKIGLAILKSCQSDLLQLNGIDQLVPYLFSIPVYRIESTILFQITHSIDIDSLLGQLKDQIREKKQPPSTSGQVLSFFNNVWNRMLTPQPVSRKRTRTAGDGITAETPANLCSKKRRVELSSAQPPRTVMGISHAPRTSANYEAADNGDSPTRRSLAGPRERPATEQKPAEGRIRYEQPRSDHPTFGTPEFASFSTPKRELKRKRSKYELTPVVIKRRMVFGEDQQQEVQRTEKYGQKHQHAEEASDFDESEWEVVRKEKRTESYGSFWALGQQYSHEEEQEQEDEIRKQLKF